MKLPIDNIIKNLVVLFLIVSGLHFAASFLIPLTVGFVLATLFLPMCRCRIPAG